MALIDYQISGAREVVDFFRSAPNHVRQALTREIDRLGIMLLQRAKMKVSGDVLNVKSGRLRRSIKMTKNRSGDGYSVSVGTNLEYAAAHEFGFTGNVWVTQHQRLVRKAWGRPVRNPQMHNVWGYDRRMRLPERSFLRSSFNELQPQMSQQLATFLQNIVTQGGGQGGTP